MRSMDASDLGELYVVKDVGEILRRQVKKRASEPAIFCDGRVTSYDSFYKHSRKVADFLVSRLSCIERRVGYIGRECEPYYEVIFGCAMAGVIFVPINWRLTPNEVAHIVTDASIDILFSDAEMLGVVEESLDMCGHDAEVVCLKHGMTSTSYFAILHSVAKESVLPACDPERTFCLIYTSGTTGLPKGVCLPHKAFFQIREALIKQDLKWLDWRQSDRCLVGIPGFHIGGLWWALQCFSSGASIVVLPKFEPQLCLTAMLDCGVTTACMVPSMINLLLDVIEQNDAKLLKLRKIVYGGGPISEALLMRGISVLGCDFAQIYGLSETGNTAVCLDPDSHLSEPSLLTAAGRPYPGVKLKIIDTDGKVLPMGEVGEVCIKTPARMIEYWGLPDATSATLQDGWIHTGDAGYLNESGYLFICDRIKDVIVTGGEKIFPAEVENVVSSFSTVHECAVIGIPNEVWGEVPICLVVPKPESAVNITDLFKFLESRLAAYKKPTQIHCVDSLPRNPSGKLLRRALRDAFWTGRKRNV
ncbi:long-chain-fatty-acid--CoA ligase [Halothiobacillus neapolitanus]|uniref:AMP-dependent synthetase and ligase n=1 Tax=Halothiobacillus neapolitanus (strain ATCC 23641 / DSM 15147 / CIP 104769 / NCIMB 8539 / c2) TaxID=555778 RepID=D0KZC4_HALNC|nr:long-chain-fatty-acid--CoA ligase [Halothiobacillus neapolitanus]ACX95797.1 AMP-dependent synthetase and ligase [Halothiobacillus neapolitanus c2]TDN66107.1 long-chain acyl-CoA synthetase [Halothiobacillus neapolitanus]